MLKFCTNVANFNIFMILIICSATIRSALSACSEDEWTCDDGSCIREYQKCDGKVECVDGSDEIAENCIHLYKSCPGFAFKCSYGACITGSYRCNNQTDCADNSDELSCHESSEQRLRGHCSAEEMECLNSKECISRHVICDGEKDCSDGSDETVEVCGDYACSPVGFHCGYGGCISGNAPCNGVNECLDGSDEAWELCQTPRKTIGNRMGVTVKPVVTVKPRPTPTPTPTPKPKPRPTPTPTPSPTLTTTTTDLASDGEVKCQIPLDADGLIFKLHPDNNTILPGSWVNQWDTVHLECSNRAAIAGVSSILCGNGTFKTEIPSCFTYCDGTLLQGLSTVYHCYHNGHHLERRLCNKKIVPDTEIEIACANGYSGQERQNIRCLANGKFTVERKRCVTECGRVQPTYVPLTRKGIKVTPNRVPWHVAIYEFDEGEYTYICSGSVISPTMVISAAHCFWNDTYLFTRPVENYKFIAGKYTRQYFMPSDGAPQIRDVESIYIDENYRGKQNQNLADVALIKLKEPLVYNENISAVCMSFSVGNSALNYVDSDIPGLVTGYGQKNTLEQVPMITKNFYSCRRDPDGEGLTDDKFCLYNENDMSICRGDSGGGFITKNGTDHYILGIISYTPSTQQDCARDGFVGVTNVRYMKEYLINTLRKEWDKEKLIL